MSIDFGREICGNLAAAETREWLVTNGIGGYASGTIAGLLTRRYHGLLVAALQPPQRRTLLVTKLDESVRYGKEFYALSTNRWKGGIVCSNGYRNIERFFFRRHRSRVAVCLWRCPARKARLDAARSQHHLCAISFAPSHSTTDADAESTRQLSRPSQRNSGRPLAHGR